MIIPNEIFALYNEAVDALLASDYTSHEAKLYYRETTPSAGEAFEDDVIENILLNTIRLRIHNKTKQWLETGGLQFVDGRCQIYGVMTDVPLIKKCTYIEIEGHNFTLTTEPLRHGFGSRYFTAYIDLIK